jgi:predicted MFS family arabinose efflux permease
MSGAPSGEPPRTGVVVALGSTQTLAWASSYYLPAILADPIARDLGISGTTVFAAFSAALLLSAALAPAAGRAIDRSGGRGVLCLSNPVFAAGLALMATATGPAVLTAAWLVMGAGMALGLYDSAFATLAGLYGRDARGAITGITLIAGFASTVGWPLSLLLDDAFGWHGTCLVWAGLHLGLGLPVNRFLVPAAAAPAPAQTAAPIEEDEAPRGAMVLLAFVFAATWVVSTGMAAHLPRLLEAAGASATAAVAAASLVGPAQVAARLLEFGLMRRLHPLASTRLATALHPAGALALVLFGGPAAAVFTVLHGAGNGLLTIAKGTLPLALFGPAGYGLRNGLLSVPARVAQAGAPLAFGLLLDRTGLGVLAVSSGLCLASTVALLALRARRHAREVMAP